MTIGSDWQSVVGDAWSQEWRRTDRSFAGLDPALDAAITAAAPATGQALDIGSGAGRTSLALAAARPDLAITGIDLSPALVAVARERAGGHSRLNFQVGDASRPPSEVAFDLLFSRHGVMFFDDPHAAFQRLHAAAAPGAPLVFSCFRASGENAWAGALLAAIGTTPAPPAGYAPSPFAFADRDFVATLLAQAGWRDATATPVDYPYVAGEAADPVADAVSFFQRIGPSAAAFRGVTGPERDAIAARLAAALEPYRQGGRVTLPAAAWIWTARA